jgi:ketosteroid isomerase-like protein
MAPTNVELVGQVVAAVNERNAAALMDLVADDFEWVTPVTNTDATVYRGPDGIRQFFEDAKAWASIEARVDEVRDLGDRALVLGQLAWRARGGSLEVTGQLASVIRFEEGKVKRIHTYRGANDAWVAAGLGHPLH